MTAQEILTAAYAKSLKNQPGRIAAESTELLEVVNRVMRTFFMVGARVNPFFFMSSAPVTYSSGWARPATAEAVYRIVFTLDLTQEVVVVPFDDLLCESLLPAVYRMGQVYYSAGNSADPTNESLTFYFSKTPTDVVALNATIDPLFPVSYKELPVLETAIYLALKDGRESEVASLTVSRDSWLNLFMAHMEHETMNERRRFGAPVPFNTASMVPIASLLAGGTSLEI